MTSPLWRLGSTLALLGIASILPATVGAQPPAYLTQWGAFGTGDGQFNVPLAVAADSAGNVYVVDMGNNRIQKFSSTGAYLTQWGTIGSGSGEFEGPMGLATDVFGNVYVTDQLNRIQKFTSAGTFITQWGSYGSGDGQFSYVLGVATDADGNVYVADAGNSRIQKFNAMGTYVTQWGSYGSGDGQFSFPDGVATDASGNVYVADVNNSRIEKFASTGVYLTQWGSAGSDTSADGRLNYPHGVAIDAADNVYVADTQNQRIQKFTNTGAYVTQWGSYGSGDGQFDVPYEVATDGAGNVYIADVGNQRIQKFGASPTPIAMRFDFRPKRLNLASCGRWVTGFLEPPAPFAARDIDVASIRLNGTVPVARAMGHGLGDHDCNGVPDLMVKFKRAAVQSTLSQGARVPVVVNGMLGSRFFTGTDYIRVGRAAVAAPLAGSHLAAGSVTQVRWQTPSDAGAQFVAVLRSLDGGDTWEVIARGQPNNGSYDWAVPNVNTNQAIVAVVPDASAEVTDDTADGALGVSEAFSIEASGSVGDRGPIEFALRAVTPNPAQRELHVSFSLKDSKAATLALFDVGGRQLAVRRVDGMGPGWHTVALGGQSDLPAGLYVIRLTQDGQSLTTRAALVR